MGVTWSAQGNASLSPGRTALVSPFLVDAVQPCAPPDALRAAKSAALAPPLMRPVGPPATTAFTNIVTTIMRNTDTIVFWTPILAGILIAWLLIRRGKTTFGVFCGLVVVFLLWLAAEYWLYGAPCRAYPTCGASYYFRELYSRRGYFVMTVVPIIVATLIARFFIRQNKIRIGFLSSIGVIVLLWLAVEWSLFSCSGPGLACEWVGVGVIFFTVLAIIEIVIVTAINWGVAWNYRRNLKHRQMTQAQ